MKQQKMRLKVYKSYSGVTTAGVENSLVLTCATEIQHVGRVLH